MMLQDAKKRILKIWGPYNPKVYDSNFIEIVSDWFNDNLKDTSIIADNLFTSANRYCENVKFLTNNKEPDNPSNMDTQEGYKRPTNKQCSWNEAHRKARARVKSPFGRIKTMFKSLGTLYRKNEESKKQLVNIACAIINLSIKQCYLMCMCNKGLHKNIYTYVSVSIFFYAIQRSILSDPTFVNIGDLAIVDGLPSPKRPTPQVSSGG